MKDLAEKLMLIEDKAATFYQAMAVYFQDDPSIAATLNSLAADEISHRDILDVVATCMTEGSEVSFPLELAQPAMSEIIRTLEACAAMARAGNLSLAKLGEAVSDIEFSEWNSLFFYVVNTFKDVSHECRIAAIQLQTHIRRVSCFLEQLPLEKQVQAKIRNLPTLWTEHILVVDDAESVRELLKAALGIIGKVEVAADGLEGLEKIKDKYYALIVSDIAMPRCDGIELFRKACKQYPSIGKRFLFFSGQVSDDHVSFIRHHNLELLDKPANLKEIRTRASALLSAPLATNIN